MHADSSRKDKSFSVSVAERTDCMYGKM